MVDAFRKSLRPFLRYQYSTIHRGTRRLKGRQEIFFHAHRACPHCKTGLPHTHVYKDIRSGKIYKERYHFPKGSKHLKGISE